MAWSQPTGSKASENAGVLLNAICTFQFAVIVALLGQLLEHTDTSWVFVLRISSFTFTVSWSWGFAFLTGLFVILQLSVYILSRGDKHERVIDPANVSKLNGEHSILTSQRFRSEVSETAKSVNFSDVIDKVPPESVTKLASKNTGIDIEDKVIPISKIERNYDETNSLDEGRNKNDRYKVMFKTDILGDASSSESDDEFDSDDDNLDYFDSSFDSDSNVRQGEPDIEVEPVDLSDSRLFCTPSPNFINNIHANVPRNGVTNNSQSMRDSERRSRRSSQSSFMSASFASRLNAITLSAFDTPLFRAVNDLERLRDMLTKIPESVLQEATSSNSVPRELCTQCENCQCKNKQSNRKPNQAKSRSVAFEKSNRKRWDHVKKGPNGRRSNTAVHLNSNNGSNALASLLPFKNLDTHRRRQSLNVALYRQSQRTKPPLFPPSSANGNTKIVDSGYKQLALSHLNSSSSINGTNGLLNKYPLNNHQKGLRKCHSQSASMFYSDDLSSSSESMTPLEIIDSVLDSLRSPDTLMRPKLHKSFSGDLSWFVGSDFEYYPTFLNKDKKLINGKDNASTKRVADNKTLSFHFSDETASIASERHMKTVEENRACSDSEVTVDLPSLEGPSEEIDDQLNAPGNEISVRHDPMHKKINITVVKPIKTDESVKKYSNGDENQMENSIRNIINESSSALKLFSSLDVDLKNWDLDVFTLAEKTDNRPLSCLLMLIFEERGYRKHFNIDLKTLFNFCFNVERGYNADLPYHNNIHAADVVNSSHFLLFVMDLSRNLNHLQCMAALFASAVHDIQHPGRTPRFLIRSKNKLAMIYNDRSILEQMHCAEAFSIVSQAENDILKNLSGDEYLEFRKLVIHAVLATDLNEHFETITKIKSLSVPCLLDVNDNPNFILEVCVKVSDLGHASKTWELHKIWSMRIQDEFFLQGDDEKELGLEVSPFMDRKWPRKAENQLGFFRFIAMPMYDGIAQVFPGFRWIRRQAKTNLLAWKQLADCDSDRLVSSKSAPDGKPENPSLTSDATKAQVA